MVTPYYIYMCLWCLIFNTLFGRSLIIAYEGIYSPNYMFVCLEGLLCPPFREEGQRRPQRPWGYFTFLR